MNTEKTITELSRQVEELTKTLNRVTSVIRGNLEVNLDLAGELAMTDEEYKSHWDAINKVDADHDKRMKRLAKLTPEQVTDEIDFLQSHQLGHALSGLGTQQPAS